jgi:hypothetical protein
MTEPQYCNFLVDKRTVAAIKGWLRCIDETDVLHLFEGAMQSDGLPLGRHPHCLAMTCNPTMIEGLFVLAQERKIAASLSVEDLDYEAAEFCRWIRIWKEAVRVLEQG